jgi:hypothetical protein
MFFVINEENFFTWVTHYEQLKMSGFSRFNVFDIEREKTLMLKDCYNVVKV